MRPPQDLPDLPALPAGATHRLRLPLPWAPSMPVDPTGAMVDLTLLATTDDGALHAVQAHAKVTPIFVLCVGRFPQVLSRALNPVLLRCP